MNVAVPPPRLKILPAKAARIALVSYRSPAHSQRYFVWDVDAGQVLSTSNPWIPINMRYVDVSWDGRLWIVPGYFNGLATIGSLKEFVGYYELGRLEQPGGYFESPQSLRIPEPPPELFANGIKIEGWPRPMTVRPIEEDPFLSKMRRDGWIQQSEPNTWMQQPTPDHPALFRQDRITKKLGAHSFFELKDSPTLLGKGVTTASYDMAGDLLVGRHGTLQRYRLDDLSSGTPCFEWSWSES